MCNQVWNMTPRKTLTLMGRQSAGLQLLVFRLSINIYQTKYILLRYLCYIMQIQIII